MSMMGTGYVDDKGNYYATAEQYCRTVGIPILTAEQLIDTGDLSSL